MRSIWCAIFALTVSPSDRRTLGHGAWTLARRLTVVCSWVAQEPQGRRRVAPFHDAGVLMGMRVFAAGRPVMHAEPGKGSGSWGA